jgi:hypothetical protein
MIPDNLDLDFPSVIICVLHVSMWYLCLKKLSDAPTQRLLRLVIRDGSCVFVTVCGQ